MPKAGRHFRQVLAEQTEALALAQLSGSASAPCPARLRDTPRADSSLLVLPEFPAHATAADAARLDSEWFMPLLHGLRIGRFRHASVTLTGPEGGSVRLGMLDAWKIWRGRTP